MSKKKITGKGLVKIRAILSTVLLVVFLIVVFTGIGLYFAPSGEIARKTGWTFFWFPLFRLERLHTISGFIMAGLVFVHFGINFNLYKNEMKQLFKRDKREQ